jgi:ribosome biogenesis GTPase
LQLKKRQELLAMLRALDANERQKLQKKATQVRKARQKGPKGGLTTRRREAWDEDFEATPAMVRKPLPIEDIMLEILAAESQVAVVAETGDPGWVISIAKGRAHVEIGNERHECLLATHIEQHQKSALAVGDRVSVVNYGDHRRIVSVMPRRTKLSRVDPDIDIERVIVANVDTVVVVVSVVAPPLHPRVIDRYLVAIGKGGARAVIAVNKIDLLGNDRSELDQLAPYRSLGVPIVECSSATKFGIDVLRAELVGQVGAFVGHSGVGKSSLLNAIRPELSLDTGGVSEGYGRGTHTTTASTMWDVGDGTRIIDTPGIRSFGLWRLTREELATYFPEFSGYRCRFRDCSHEREPGCEIRAAVASGAIAEARFDTFQRLRETL